MRTLRLLLGIAALLLIAAGCDWVDENTEQHAEAEGLRLSEGGADLVTVREGKVEGKLSLRAGTAPSRIVVTYLDADGEAIKKAQLEDDLLLAWTLTDESVASVQADPVDPRSAFSIQGHTPGIAGLTLRLMHGDHADFTTPPGAIVVTVIP